MKIELIQELHYTRKIFEDTWERLRIATKTETTRRFIVNEIGDVIHNNFKESIINGIEGTFKN